MANEDAAQEIAQWIQAEVSFRGGEVVRTQPPVIPVPVGESTTMGEMVTSQHQIDGKARQRDKRRRKRQRFWGIKQGEAIQCSDNGAGDEE